MYSKRQKLYREQTYRGASPVASLSSVESSEEREPREERQRERSASVASTATTHIPRDERPIDRPPVIYAPRPPTKRVEGMVYRPIEVGYRTKVVTQRRLEDGYEQAQYDTELRRTIPKKVDWQLMSDDVRKQMRTILSNDYRKTLLEMADPEDGVITDALKTQGESFLKPIAAQIDKTLRLTLLPDPVDIKLLDPELPQETDNLDSKLKIDLKLTAELSMKIDEKSALLSERREVLDELKIKNRLAKEKLSSLTNTAFDDDPNDYVQMLFKYPSSNDY